MKEAEVAAPLDAVLVHHLEHTSGSGHRIRYFVVDFPDGRWLAESHLHMKENGNPAPCSEHPDAFIAALGSRATPIG